LLLPAVQKTREAAARAQCQNNLKQMALAWHSYHDVNESFPAGGTYFFTFADGSKTQTPWTVLILPYIEQGGLYQKYYSMTAATIYGTSLDANVNPSAAVIPTYLCPSDDFQDRHVYDVGGYYTGAFSVTRVPGAAFGTCNYLANGGYGSPWSNTGVAVLMDIPGTGDRITDVVDGTSNTLLLGEHSTHHDPLWTATAVAHGVSPTSCCWGVGTTQTDLSYTAWNAWWYDRIG